MRLNLVTRKTDETEAESADYKGVVEALKSRTSSAARAQRGVGRRQDA